MRLMDKMRSDVDAEHRQNLEKAHQNVRDWAARQAAAGFSGHAVSPDGPGAAVYDMGGASEAQETLIPASMTAHLSRIMRERDRLVADKMRAVARVLSVQEKGECTTLAIEIVRNQINGVRAVVSSTDNETQKGESNGNETPNDTGHPAGAAGDESAAPSSTGTDPGVSGEGSSGG